MTSRASKRRFACLELGALVGLTLFGFYPARATPSSRIDFAVTTVETSGGHADVVSRARIDGPPGTDFTVRLDSGRFEMRARFRTEPSGDDALKIHSKLETRRFYGMSERNLPLYEEDDQRSVIDLRLGDTLLLLPFGGEDEAENLKIEIVPGWSEKSATLPGGDLRPLEIDLREPAPGGIVTVQAETIPHWFEIEAAVVADGVELARGRGRVFIEERGRIVVEPLLGASRPSAPDRLYLDLTVDRFERSRPADQVAVSFDIVPDIDGHETLGSPVATNWAGVVGVGSSLTYDLPSGLFAPGAKAEIRIGVRVAAPVGRTR